MDYIREPYETFEPESKEDAEARWDKEDREDFRRELEEDMRRREEGEW